MIIEIKVPAMSAVEIATLNEDLNQVVYNHTGVIGESKLSDKKELESELKEAVELLGESNKKLERYKMICENWNVKKTAKEIAKNLDKSEAFITKHKNK